MGLCSSGDRSQRWWWEAWRLVTPSRSPPPRQLVNSFLWLLKIKGIKLEEETAHRPVTAALAPHGLEDLCWHGSHRAGA